MARDIITVTTGGRAYSSWTNALVRASMKEAARSFQLDIAAEAGAAATAWTFKAGADLSITIDGEPVLVGFVDRYRPRIGPLLAQATITGRSKSGDLVDCSCEHPTGRFEDKSALDIANELGQPFGVTVTADEDLPPLPSAHQLTPGASAFSEIEKLARQEGLTLMGEADGNIRLTKAGSKRHGGAIIEGLNLMDGEADHNWSNRHSRYVVRGQSRRGTTADELEIEAIARDSGVGRGRPVVIIEEAETDKDRAKKTAKNRRDKSAGESLRARIKVQGFRAPDGMLWTPGYLIWVESAFLNLAQDMLIEGVTFSQDDNSGSTADLDLVDPRAHGGKKGKGDKSDPAWGSDDSDAE